MQKKDAMQQSSDGKYFYWRKVNGKKRDKGVRPASGDRVKRREKRETETDRKSERDREREMRGEYDLYKRECSECAQKVLLVAIAVDV